MSVRTSTQRGVTLIELIVFIVIVTVGLAGVMASLNISAKGSADPLQPKQALAIAEGLLEEILLKDYCDPSMPSVLTPITVTTVAGSNVVTCGSSCTTGISVGWQVIASGIPAGTTVTTVTSTTQLALSSNALVSASGVSLTPAACESTASETRTTYDNLRDYDAYSANPASMLDGTTLAGYSVSASVPSATVNVNGVAMRQVTVTVTSPSGSTYALTGYRAPY